LNLLDQVSSVRIGQQGQLLLSTPGGESIRAFQSDHDSP
ncbi:MAG TPA: secreted protein containing HslJ-like protein, partial [Marinobacter adhaerens]|nr:secreted protein containing HslJ-like protein [Marinobacter adhaerens]